MSNDKQPTAASVAGKPSRPEGTMCKMIRFVASEDVPGSEMQQTLRGRKPGTEKNKDDQVCHHEIEFQPWQRHYRVTYFDRSKDGAQQTVYIHETRVRSYEAW